MTTKRPDDPHTRHVTVEDELRRIRRILMVVVVLYTVLLGVTTFNSFRASSAASDASTTSKLAAKNTGRIDALVIRVKAQEREDRDALRDAAWRGCVRDQLERADLYAGQKEALASPEVRRAFPQELIDRALDRRSRNLPILNCDPNLCGEQPTIPAKRIQERLVAAYEKGRLEANPRPPEPNGRVCPAGDVPLQLERAARTPHE